MAILNNETEFKNKPVIMEDGTIRILDEKLSLYMKDEIEKEINNHSLARKSLVQRAWEMNQDILDKKSYSTVWSNYKLVLVEHEANVRFFTAPYNNDSFLISNTDDSMKRDGGFNDNITRICRALADDVANKEWCKLSWLLNSANLDWGKFSGYISFREPLTVLAIKVEKPNSCVNWEFVCWEAESMLVYEK